MSDASASTQEWPRPTVPDPAEFEPRPHFYVGGATKADLAAHLTKPHKQRDGGWLSNAGPVSEIMKWRRDEIERTHAEYHADA